MKLLTGSSLFAIFFAAATYAQQPVAAVKTTSAKPQKEAGLNLRGVYQMTRQVISDGTRDSLVPVQQLKMFTDRHMIYVHPGPDDSLAVYGVGTYTVENGKVVEQVFYTSGDGPVKERYELAIKKSGDGFSQVIHFGGGPNGQTSVLTEDYKTISRGIAHPLDGAWRQTSRTVTTKEGKSTTMDTPVQFKFYNAGHYVWVASERDSATGKVVSFYGYGTFNPTGKNSLVETTMRSSFKTQLVGRPVTLEIKMPDKTHYEQTIVWPTGEKMTEVYQRL